MYQVYEQDNRPEQATRPMQPLVRSQTQSVYGGCYSFDGGGGGK